MCCGPYRVVLAGCMDEGNGGWIYLLERGARPVVSVLCCVFSCADLDRGDRKRLFGDI